MFTKRIIPCLDVNNGRVVKGVNFVDLRDAGDPVEVAKVYDKEGADELVFLDITASSDARNTVVDMVEQVAENVFIPFTVGGGIRTVEDFRTILRAGADKISINSSALNTPDLISDAAYKFGSQCVVVAIDAKKRADGSGWNVYKNGGRIDTGRDAVEWALRMPVPPGKERRDRTSYSEKFHRKTGGVADVYEENYSMSGREQWTGCKGSQLCRFKRRRRSGGSRKGL